MMADPNFILPIPLLLRRRRRKSLCRFSHKILLYNKTSCASLIFGSCVLSTAKKKPRVSPLNKPCNLSSAARLPSPASKNFSARRWYFTHNLQRTFPIKRYSNNLRCRVCKRALEQLEILVEIHILGKCETAGGALIKSTTSNAITRGKSIDCVLLHLLLLMGLCEMQTKWAPLNYLALFETRVNDFSSHSDFDFHQ